MGYSGIDILPGYYYITEYEGSKSFMSKGVVVMLAGRNGKAEVKTV